MTSSCHSSLAGGLWLRRPVEEAKTPRDGGVGAPVVARLEPYRPRYRAGVGTLAAFQQVAGHFKRGLARATHPLRGPSFRRFRPARARTGDMEQPHREVHVVPSEGHELADPEAVPRVRMTAHGRVQAGCRPATLVKACHDPSLIGDSVASFESGADSSSGRVRHASSTNLKRLSVSSMSGCNIAS